jgi:pimeloyl-ACP methyl ester carboxylesterase
VLFLHGYLSNKESFFYQINCLAENNFKVTAPDIYGFGKSSKIDSPMSVGDYACWLKDFMRAARLNKPHIIAHSFGARVAVKLLATDGNFCERLIITGGAGIVKQRSPQYMRRVKAYRTVKRLCPKFAEKHFGSGEYRTLSPIMKESYKKIVNEDLQGCLAKIQNRTLLIYGEDDDTTPIGEEGATFNRLIENSELIKMKGGHFCFSQYPEEFNNIILHFLRDGENN